MAKDGKKPTRTRRLLAAAVLAALLAAGAWLLWPRMTVAGCAGYSREGLAAYQALTREDRGCLLGNIHVGRWDRTGRQEPLLPCVIRDAVVYGADGAPLPEQPERLVLDLGETRRWPGAGVYDSAETLLEEQVGGAALTALPGAFRTDRADLAVLLLFTDPLAEDAAAWEVRVRYDVLGIFPASARGPVFTELGE